MGTFMTAKLAFEDLKVYNSPHKKKYLGTEPKVISPEKTMFLLDWDDTLMCTTFLSIKKENLDESEKPIVSYLGEKVSEFLSKCKKYGKVVILTNSTKQWVKSSALNLLKLKPDIFDDILIISSRDKYEKKGAPKEEWKKIALKEFQKHFNQFENLICISDSQNDINSFKTIKEKFCNENDNTFCTIKLKSKPSPLVIIKEIQFLTKNLKTITGSNDNYILDDEDYTKFKEKPILNLSLFDI